MVKKLQKDDPLTTIDRRIGTFEIDSRLVQTHAPIFMQIMGRCIVIRCEHMYEKAAFAYTALSPDFDEVPEGYRGPVYVWEIDVASNKADTIRAIRQPDTFEVNLD